MMIEKCDSEREGDVVDEMGNTSGVLGDRHTEKGKGEKVVTGTVFVYLLQFPAR
jgi:hypothetical protein